MYQQPQYGGQPPQQYQQQPGYQQPQQDLFVGSGKVRQAPFGPVMRFSLNRNDLEKLLNCLNEQGWVSFEIMAKRQPSQSGATHYGKIDLWQPQPQMQQQYGQMPPQGYYAPQPQPQPQYGQMPRNPVPPQPQMPTRPVNNGGFAPPPPPQQPQAGYAAGGYSEADCPPPMPPPPQQQQMPPMPQFSEPQEDGIPF